MKGTTDMNNRTHRIRNGKPTATFEELSYAEQAKAINMAKLNLKKMEKAHLRRARAEGRTT
jgi:hypothetical protein